MVDVTEKAATDRTAVASCVVTMSASARAAVMSREVPKGDALEVARIAGIMAAKKTSELIPLCHPIALGGIEVSFQERDLGIEVTASVRTVERTGVEMEAMTAAVVAGLTIYDMVKSLERGAEVTEVRLVRKSGGRSGEWERGVTG